MPLNTSSASTSAKNLVALCAVMLVAFVLFVPTVGHDFVNFDDDIYVYDNPHVQLLTWENVSWLFSNIYYTQYIPLTMISHAADIALWKFDPRGHHLTNILLHTANTGWVFLLALVCSRLVTFRSSVGHDASPSGFSASDALWSAALASLLFAVHPLRVESVAWISDRKDLLCAFFLLPMMLTYIQYALRRDQASARLWFAATFILFIFAVLSKAIAAVSPLVLVACDYLLPQEVRPKLRTSFLEKIPLFLVAAVVIWVTFSHAPDLKRNIVVSKLTGVDVLLFPLYAMAFYLKKLILPIHLSPLYGSAGTALMLAGSVAVCVVTVACLYFARKGKPYPLLSWTIYLLFLVPTVAGVSSGMQPYADRYTYIATIGMFIMIGGWCVTALRKLSREYTAAKFLVALPAAVIILFGYLSFAQAKHWKSSEELWKHAIALGDATDNYVHAYYNLGTAYLSDGKRNEAFDVLQQAVDISPQAADSYYYLGYAYYDLRKLEEALESFRKTTELDSTYTKAYYNQAIIYSELGNDDQAIEAMKRAARLGLADAQNILKKRNIDWIESQQTKGE
jgi:tetratricopeptide (TPR) repeat protein